MSHAAAVVAEVEITISMPSALLRELEDYAELKDGATVAWAA